MALCRLRIGHTLASHRYLLCGEPKPRCHRCNEFLSVSHVLISCRGLAELRTRILGSDNLNLKDLLFDGSVHITRVMQFIDEVDFAVIYKPAS